MADPYEKSSRSTLTHSIPKARLRPVRLILAVILGTCCIAAAGFALLPKRGAVGAPDTALVDASAASADSLGALPLFYASYRIRKGETVSDIADRNGVSVDSIVSVNGIKSTREIQAGTALRIPNQDGILYKATSADTVASLVKRYGLDEERVRLVNDIPDDDALEPGRTLFLPDAKLDDQDLRRINGDEFIFPVIGWRSDSFGWRKDPFTGERAFHNGIDIAAPLGTTVKAAMAGRISATGYDPSSGNYIVITHHGGYRTSYFHLSAIGVQTGQSVAQGQAIGKVGNTGHSTGSHLHFSVTQYGRYIRPPVYRY
jgi:murein DD-endopeptidase MepM/ murein hydrolase activator NlpD